MSKRIYQEKVSINEEAIKEFFSHRATNYNPDEPLVSILYQDSNPKLAQERDIFEKNKIIPLLNLNGEENVLDMGCGIGRWAEALSDKVAHYHGTDLDEQLINIANDRFKNNNNVTFQTLVAKQVTPDNLSVKPPYDLIIVAGVFQYINDQGSDDVLKELALCCKDNSIIYIRATIGVKERLTLNQVWSEELKYEYSSIYRTHDEYIEMFSRTLLPSGFKIEVDESLYPENLNNREETKQHFFILRKMGE